MRFWIDSTDKSGGLYHQEILGQQDLALQVRSQLESVLELQLKDLIKEVLGVGVTDLLSDATLETGRTGTIAILESAPKVREASSKSKTQPEVADC